MSSGIERSGTQTGCSEKGHLWQKELIRSHRREGTMLVAGVVPSRWPGGFFRKMETERVGKVNWDQTASPKNGGRRYLNYSPQSGSRNGEKAMT